MQKPMPQYEDYDDGHDLLTEETPSLTDQDWQEVLAAYDPKSELKARLGEDFASRTSKSEMDKMLKTFLTKAGEYFSAHPNLSTETAEELQGSGYNPLGFVNIKAIESSGATMDLLKEMKMLEREGVDFKIQHQDGTVMLFEKRS